MDPENLTIEEQLSEATARVEVLTASVAELEQKNAMAGESIAKLTADLDAAQALMGEQEKALADKESRIVAIEGERDAERARADEASAKLELIEKANGLRGVSAESVGATAPAASITEQYLAITDPAKRVAFIREHKADLEREIRNASA